MKCLLITAVVVLPLAVCGCNSRNTNEAAKDASRKISDAANTLANKTSEVAESINRSAGPAMNDAAITARIKAKLLADSITGTDVDTAGGVVTLTGAVATGEQKARAEEHAKETEGVKGVRNELAVRTQ